MNLISNLTWLKRSKNASLWGNNLSWDLKDKDDLVTGKNSIWSEGKQRWGREQRDELILECRVKKSREGWEESRAEAGEEMWAWPCKMWLIEKFCLYSKYDGKPLKGTRGRNLALVTLLGFLLMSNLWWLRRLAQPAMRETRVHL